MARVFEIPTYKLQTYRAVSNLMDLAVGEQLIDSRPDATRFRRREPCEGGFEAFDCGFMDIGIDEWDDQNVLVKGAEGVADDEFADASLDYQRFCFLEGLKTHDVSKYTKLSYYGMAIAKILEKFRLATIWTDFDAAQEICRMFYSKELCSTVPGTQKHVWNRAADKARQIVAAGLTSCQLGSGPVAKALSCIVDYEHMSDDLQKSKNAAEAWERARMSSITKSVKAAHATIEDGDFTAENFRIKDNYVASNLGFAHIYKVSMFLILVPQSRDKVFVLDYAHLDQVRELMRSWHGMELYAEHYRKSTGDAAERDRFMSAYRKCFAWLIESMGTTKKTNRLAKYMKTCLARIQNDFHDHSEKLSMGAAGRSEGLKREADALLELETSWYDALLASGARQREMNNLGYMFHLLAGPDADPGAVFNRVVNQMNNANVADERHFELFMRYAMATDAAKFTLESKGNIQLKCEEGYVYKDKEWWKACRSGNLYYPPEEEWGKCWVENSIPVPRTIENWYTTASDVTRVPPRLSDYNSQSKKVQTGQFETNELLYTLKNAPDIVPGLKPSDLMDKLAAGDYTWDKIADMSIKSENTKEGPKMRETWSGDAITREILSEFDHAIIPIASHYKGVTSRKTDSQVLSIFDKMCEYTVGEHLNAIVSTDISGWSPSADRDAWCRHHQYVFNMTTMFGQIDLHKVLSGIKACISKRGTLKTASLNRGMFQGWTGTADTILNNKVCLLSTRIGKTRGYLPMEATADTASLIDDAVQGIQFPRNFTKEQAERAAQLHLQTTTEVWKWVSAEVSTVKTLYSTIKFIFLNRFHCEGSEVLTDMKTFAKVDRDLSRRLSTINQQCDTVIGGYRSAVAKGSDPLVGYACAIVRCLELVIKTNMKFDDLSAVQAVVASFAPRPLCGLGLPHFTAFCTKEKVDALTMFLGTCARVRRIMTTEGHRIALDTSVSSFINQPLAKPGPLGAISDPWSVRSKNFIGHETSIYRRLKDRMRQKCESEVIREAFELSDNPECAKAVDALLRSYSIDAHILAALSETLPESVISGMIDKAHKADLILSLFKFSIRSELIVKMIMGNRDQIRVCYEVASSAGTACNPVTVENYIHVATALRERYFESSGYNILNNTNPDPATMLARQNTASGTTITVQCNRIYSQCGDMVDGVNDTEVYRNVFDGTPETPGRRGFVTKGIFDYVPEAARGMDPVQKCILKASQIIAHVSGSVDTEAAPELTVDLWVTFCAAWGAREEIDYKLPLFYINKEVSLKRIDTSSFNRSHPTVCYPNSHNSVRVNAVVAGRLFDIVKSQTNLASLITAAKTIGLVERAPYPDGINSLYYSVLEEAFIPFGVQFIYKVAEEIDRSPMLERFAEARGAQHGGLCTAFTQAMTNYVDLAPAPEDYGDVTRLVGLVFTQGKFIGGRQHDDTIRQQLSQYFNDIDIVKLCLMPSYYVAKKQKIVRGVTDKDESVSRYNLSSDKKFEMYKAYGNSDQAALQVMVEVIIDSSPKRIPDEIYIAGWGSAESAVERAVPNWKEILYNAVVCTKSLKGYSGIRREVLAASLGRLRVADELLIGMRGTEVNDNHLSLFTSLYYFGLGKYRDPNMYVSNARAYSGQMIKQWKFASRAAEVRAATEKNDQARKQTFEIVSGIYHCAVEGYKKGSSGAFARNLFYRVFSFVFGPEAISHAMLDMASTKDARRMMIEQLATSHEEIRYDAAHVNTAFDSVCSDFLANMTRSDTHVEVFGNMIVKSSIAVEEAMAEIVLGIPDVGMEFGTTCEGAARSEASNLAQESEDLMIRWKYELAQLYIGCHFEDLVALYNDKTLLRDPNREITKEVRDDAEEVWQCVLGWLHESQAEGGEMLNADEGQG